MDPRELHLSMLRPETYPEEGPVEFKETHVSRLYLTPEYVYKIKKPVDFGFLNFTTLDSRSFYCHEEVRLNRRFAPGIYLGVADIRRTGAGIRIAAQGEIVEHAVRMRRLPANRMLDHLIAVGADGLTAEMDRLGRRIADLHAASEVVRNEDGRSNFEVVRLNWRENFEQIAPLAGRTVSPPALTLMTAYVNRFLLTRAPLLRRREREGLVRDCHGDLHAEHVCLTDQVLIYDCIEFNRRFRVGDTEADLAFLLMDLEFRGRHDLAARLLAAYREGHPDLQVTEDLLTFYKLYRAFVRGKVNSFLAEDASATSAFREAATTAATGYFNLALGYLSGQVLVLTSGLMGTGKTTIGAALAVSLGADHLRSDALRKELAGARAAEGRAAGFGEGIYNEEFNRRTYELLLQRAIESLKAGRSVVADASFARREDRDRFRQAAFDAGIPPILLVMECDRETALRRLDRRNAEGGGLSDGRRELFARQADLFEFPTGAEEAIRVDTTRQVAYNVHLLLCQIIEKTNIPS